MHTRANRLLNPSDPARNSRTATWFPVPGADARSAVTQPLYR